MLGAKKAERRNKLLTCMVAHEGIQTLVDTFYEYIWKFELSLALWWDLTSTYLLTKFWNKFENIPLYELQNIQYKYKMYQTICWKNTKWYIADQCLRFRFSSRRKKRKKKKNSRG